MSQKEEKREFLKIFEKEKNPIQLPEILKHFNCKSETDIRQKLSDWKLSDFFDITPDLISRNTKPTSWDKLKEVLKKTGKFALGKGIPIAIGLATGGVGLAAIAPLVSELILKFRKQNIEFPENAESDIKDIIESKSDQANQSVNSLVQKTTQKNSTMATQQPARLENLIKLTLNEQLHPVINEVQSTLEYLQTDRVNMLNIMDGWYASFGEQRQQLQVILELEDQIATSMDHLAEKQEQTNEIIRNLSRTMDHFFSSLFQGNLADMTADELKRLSVIQFQQINLSGKYSQPYDSTLFIEDSEVTETFNEYLKHNKNHPVFLILANVGMGKTWNSVFLGEYARNQENPAVPFFIPLTAGYKSVLKGIFGTDNPVNIGEKIQQIFEQTHAKIIFIFDGLDEYDYENRTPFFSFLYQLIVNSHQSLQMIISDRVFDWCKSDDIVNARSKIENFIYPIDAAGKKIKLHIPVSTVLEGFSDRQLEIAIERYGLDSQKISPKLQEICHRPYILRLIYENQKYPDPENVKQFESLFYNSLDQKNTILYRMGITGETEELFFRLLSSFESSTAIRTLQELESIVLNRPEQWHRIKLSGLILEEQTQFITKYHFDAIFQPIIQYFIELQKGKDYSKIAQQLFEILSTTILKENFLQALSRYALDPQEFNQLLKACYQLSMGQSLLSFLRLKVFIPIHYGSFIANPLNYPDLSRILWDTNINNLPEGVPREISRLKWLRIAKKWPWSKSEFVMLIKYIYSIEDKQLDQFVAFLEREISYDDTGFLLRDYIFKINDHQILIEGIIEQAKRSGDSLKQLVINEVMHFRPPLTLSAIYDYGKAFPKEMDAFFKLLENEGIILEILHNSSDGLTSNTEFINNYLPKWENLRKKIWSGHVKDLINFISQLFSVEFSTAKRLQEIIRNDGIRFIDENGKVVSDNDIVRDIIVVGQNVKTGVLQFKEEAERNVQQLKEEAGKKNPKIENNS